MYEFFWSYIDSFGGPNFWNRLQNIHNFWSCNLVWDIEQLDIGDYLLDWAIHRDDLKVKKKIKMFLEQNDERESPLLFCFLYASVYEMAAGGRCFVWDDLTE